MPTGQHSTSEALSVTLADLPSLMGQRLGPSRPVLVTQEQVMGFAEATHDRQWLHTDPARAAAGPFGTTVAHGYLTLALQTSMLWDVLEVSDADTVLNCGLDKVRFISPVPVGSELVMDVEVTDVSPVPGGHQLSYTATITVPGAARPSCVAQVLFRYLSSKEV